MAILREDLDKVLPERSAVADTTIVKRDRAPAGDSPTAEEIAVEAYAIYQGRGEEHGRDLDDWLEAERRLRALGNP